MGQEQRDLLGSPRFANNEVREAHSYHASNADMEPEHQHSGPQTSQLAQSGTDHRGCDSHDQAFPTHAEHLFSQIAHGLALRSP